MAQSENSAPGFPSMPALSASHTGLSHAVIHSTHCSSPATSMQGPFRYCRKRPASPAGSLSTLASSGKKACFSALSDTKQPRTTLLNYHPYNKHAAFPSHTALTSAVTEADEDDCDEAVSSFRAPPGHIAQPDDLPLHVLRSQAHQGHHNMSLHSQRTVFPFTTSSTPAPLEFHNFSDSSAHMPMHNNSKSSSCMPGVQPHQSGLGPTTYMPAAGILSGNTQSAWGHHAADSALAGSSWMGPDQADCKHMPCLIDRRHSLPSMAGHDLSVTQVSSCQAA